MTLEYLWKALSLLTAIALLDLILVHCIPTGEVHSSNNNSQGSWSGLSDILNVDHFDPGWQDRLKSDLNEGENAQVGEVSSSQMNKSRKKKPKQRRKRNTPEDRAKQKLYLQNYRNSLKMNPEAQKKYKQRQNMYTQKWLTKKMSRLTESEKEAYLLEKQQARLQYRRSDKEKYGGFSSKKMKRLNEIRESKKQGKASEDDLKFLKDYQVSQKLKRRKERAVLKGKDPKD